ncbi:transposase domain-containing protein [Streptomyces sp. NPDC013457]|uniref:transposase domain-containing protein n=1 Tax=Streptomyces sp. NPDC013457 TaxID=3364866 RepID=UPI0036F75BDE
MLTQVFLPESVDEVVAGRGRVEQRSQLLPAMVVVYFALAIRLFSGEGYEEVTRPLTQRLERLRRWKSPDGCRRRRPSAGPADCWPRSR